MYVIHTILWEIELDIKQLANQKTPVPVPPGPVTTVPVPLVPVPVVAQVPVAPAVAPPVLLLIQTLGKGLNRILGKSPNKTKHLLTVTRAVIRTRPTSRTVSQDERNVLTHGIDANATDTDQYNFTESRSMTSVTVLVYSKCTVHETFRF